MSRNASVPGVHERARNSMPFGQLNHSTWGLAWASRAVINHSSPGFGCGVHHTVQICAPQPRARTTEILPLDAACLHNARVAWTTVVGKKYSC